MNHEEYSRTLREMEHNRMIADVFGLHGREPTDQEIDRGAKALRQKEQGGKLLREWNGLRPSEKRKWLDKAKIVLRAALRA